MTPRWAMTMRLNGPMTIECADEGPFGFTLHGHLIRWLDDERRVAEFASAALAVAHHPPPIDLKPARKDHP